MATKPQPVPWPDVVDLLDELRDWLVAHGHANQGDDPHRAAWKFLSRLMPDDAPARRVASAIVDLELYRGAGRREDELQNTARAKELSEELRAQLFDDALERQADRAIRALFPRFEQVRRLLVRAAQRTQLREALVPVPHQVADERHELDEAAVHAMLMRLNRIIAETRELCSDFQDVNPARTDYALNLSGWQELERVLRKELRGLGVGGNK